ELFVLREPRGRDECVCSPPYRPTSIQPEYRRRAAALSGPLSPDAILAALRSTRGHAQAKDGPRLSKGPDERDRTLVGAGWLCRCGVGPGLCRSCDLSEG